MKSLLTIILSIALFVNSNAQVVANDSAETGQRASEMTFYSLKTGAKTVVSNTDWHLAITIRPTAFPNSPLGGTTIRINEPIGVKVYYVPNANAAAFNTVDTTGYESWTKQHDSDTLIDLGALNSNRNLANQFDFGWGIYNGSSHNVVGDSFYLIKLPNGELKKFMVVNLDKDTAYNLKYSNIDNSDLQTIHISKKEHVGKEFMYLNLIDNMIHDKEPLSSDWDLQFLKYSATDILQGQHVSTVGVWLNKGTKAAKRSGYDVTDNNYSNLTFSNHLNAIGWDWKRLGSFQALISGKNIEEMSEFYYTNDSLAYFVQTNGGEFYKVVFTRYNVGNGHISFYKEKLDATGINEAAAENSFHIFPNPANQILNVVLNSGPAIIRIIDISGRIISEDTYSESITQLNTSDFANGVYLMMVTSNGKTSASKFVVSR